MALPPGISYAVAHATLTKYVTFGFRRKRQFSPVEKREITRYHGIVFGRHDAKTGEWKPGLTASMGSSFKAVKASRKARLAIHGPETRNAPRLKVVFLPIVGGREPRLIRKGGTYQVEYGAITKQPFFFSPWDPDEKTWEEHIWGETQKAIEKARKIGLSDFVPMTGNAERQIIFDAENVAEDMMYLASAYEASPEWLHGIYAYAFKTPDAKKQKTRKASSPRRLQRRQTIAAKANELRKLLSVEQLQALTGSASKNHDRLAKLAAGMLKARKGE